MIFRKKAKEAGAKLVDALTPGDDTLHIRLVRRDGSAHSGLYKDGDKETVSRTFPRTKR